MSEKTTLPPAETTEVATTQTTAVATTEERLGFENVSLQDITLPVAKLLQPMSAEVADDSYADYNFKAGMVVNDTLLEKMPDTFIPLSIKDTKVLFVPKQDAAKQKLVLLLQHRGVNLTEDDLKSNVLCRSDDDKCGSRFGKCDQCRLAEFDGNEAPFCTKNINVMALFAEQSMPVIVRFSNTSHKHGKAFRNLAFLSGGHLFSRKYKLVPVKKTDKGNTWYELTAKPMGKCTDDELAEAKASFDIFANMIVRTRDEAPEVAEATTEHAF